MLIFLIPMRATRLTRPEDSVPFDYLREVRSQRTLKVGKRTPVRSYDPSSLAMPSLAYFLGFCRESSVPEAVTGQVLPQDRYQKQ